MKRITCRPFPLIRLSLALVVATLLLLSLCSPSHHSPSYRGAKRIDMNHVEFDDGDTFLYEKEPIRILGIDCPETKNPNVGIYENQPYGVEAAESTQTLMLRARVVEYAADGRDYYGRLLAHIFVDGELLGVKLIQSGLAYETVSNFGDNGFPDLAQQILDASRDAPKPPFQNPYLWRKKHQKKRK